MFDAACTGPASIGEAARVADAYHEHAVALRGYAAARLRNSAAAEDVVHEAFLRLAQQSRRGQYPSRPGAWLHQVVLNLIISAARRAEVARRHAALLEMDVATTDSPESYSLAAERCRSLESVISGGSAEARTGLVMAAQGYSGREIAGALGRTEVSTRTLLSRARSAFRRSLLSEEAREAGDLRPGNVAVEAAIRCA